jgi:alpha-tubulin suppressor-like RCC1 family protein
LAGFKGATTFLVFCGACHTFAMRKYRIVFVIAFAAMFLFLLSYFSHQQGRLKLPVGQGTPVISLGEMHGIILASDGSLWSWGKDFYGWPVLGLGKETNQLRLRRIGNDSDWRSISSSSAHNLAIKSNGTLWAWGENVYGQFGTGIVGKSNAMANIPVPAAPGNDWKQAAAGGSHSVGLKEDGTLWSWGINWAGQLGNGSTSISVVPVQVGSGTNWVKVWAGLLETVAQQSDGSLWYWGENPDPAFPQGSNVFMVPTRVSPDTNWVDVGFGVNTVFAIKSDGTLWTWGRNAHVYTGVTNSATELKPVQIGTNSDWRGISACGGWWCTGLTKKDGSFWVMDASDSKPNGPRPPFKPVQFRRVNLPNDIVAYTAGAAHAQAPGHHEPIGVALTRDGEVWTWGMVLGDAPSIKGTFQDCAIKLVALFGRKVQRDRPPVMRMQPWQLRNEEAAIPKKN